MAMGEGQSRCSVTAYELRAAWEVAPEPAWWDSIPLQLVEQHGVVCTIKSLTQVNRRQARDLTGVEPPSRPLNNLQQRILGGPISVYGGPIEGISVYLWPISVYVATCNCCLLLVAPPWQAGCNRNHGYIRLRVGGAGVLVDREVALISVSGNVNSAKRFREFTVQSYCMRKVSNLSYLFHCSIYRLGRHRHTFNPRLTPDCGEGLNTPWGFHGSLEWVGGLKTNEAYHSKADALLIPEM